MRGILLLNVGTPADCSKPAVERFIGDMLSDPLVLDKFKLGSKLLARQVIAPLSAAKSLEKYSLIWRKEEPTMSPILYYMYELCKKLEKQKNTSVEIAMRSGSPTIENAFEALIKKEPQLTEVVIFPLVPHYAQSSTQTLIEEVKRIYKNNTYPFELKIVK